MVKSPGILVISTHVGVEAVRGGVDGMEELEVKKVGRIEKSVEKRKAGRG